MNSVIVIGNNYSSVLELIRSLGTAGYEVRLLALSQVVDYIAAKSKYVKKSVYVPADFFEQESEEAELDALEELRGDEDRILVIPCRDITCIMLERNWERLSRHYIIPNIRGTKGELGRFSDKALQEALAVECGIRTPQGKVFPTTPEGIGEAVRRVGFPCFMKPLSSMDTRSEKKYLRVCGNEEDLRSWMRRAAEEGGCSRVLLEKDLSGGREVSAYGAAADGRVCLPACILTIRDGLGTHKGVAAEGMAVSSSMLGELRGRLEEFVRRSGLNGLFCIDLMEKDGEYYFMEMNLRMGGSCYAVTEAGANLPAALAGMVYGKETGLPGDIEREVHFVNERIDVDNFRNKLLTAGQLRKYFATDAVRFVRSGEDPQPWRQMKKKSLSWTVARYLSR